MSRCVPTIAGSLGDKQAPAATLRFSLVIATLGRTSELVRLLQSLDGQTYRRVEIIIVDQNSDDRLLSCLEQFKERCAIKHLKTAPGVSRARNIGLQQVTGDVICFPDDDCWYGPDLLQDVHALFAAHSEWDGLIGDAVDASGKPTLPWRDRPGPLTLAMSWRRSVTYAYFLRREALQRVTGFDEELGPGSGSPWGCGEDNDLMLRVLKAGFRVQYEPKVRVFHPRMFPAYDEVTRQKRYRYALGDGHLLRKHPMPAWWVILFFAVPAFRMTLSCLRFRADEVLTHWATLRGRMAGTFMSDEG